VRRFEDAEKILTESLTLADLPQSTILDVLILRGSVRMEQGNIYGAVGGTATTSVYCYLCLTSMHYRLESGLDNLSVPD